MKITRTITNNIQTWLRTYPEIIVIYGARQVGKTTLSEILLQGYHPSDILSLNGDVLSDRDGFDFSQGQSVEKFFGNKKILFIDEAQRFPNIGLNLKIVYDKKLPLRIIVTGSSSLDIASTIQESLTGRMMAWHLYPFSIEELGTIYHHTELQKMIPRLMIYGFYPDVFFSNDNDDAKRRLQQLTSNYLYKDILEYGGIRKPDVLVKLLQLLAFQISSQVSYHELGQQLGLNNETVLKYIDLLEQSFIIYRLTGRSTNLRNELKRGVKIYFWDLGVRNALINNFNPLDYRDDVGKLRENFVIIERAKYLQNHQRRERMYFRRDYQQREIDLVEQKDDKLAGYEIKRNDKKKTKSYAHLIGATSTQTIHRNNVLDFVTTE